MSVSAADLQRFEAGAAEAEAMVDALRAKVAQLRGIAEAKECARLRKANAELETKIAKAKVDLAQAEAANGIEQIPLPGAGAVPKAAAKAPAAAAAPAPAPAASAKPAAATDGKGKKATPAKDGGDAKQSKKGGKGGKGGASSAAADDKPVDVSRLDMRVGKVLDIKPHPDAEKLYVESIDVGEAEPRTVISGLKDYIPMEQIKDRTVIVMANLKPAKMRGILSQAMLMCANSGDDGEARKVEILDPPAGSVPGDRIVFEGYDGEPDAQLPPKKKIFEAVQPDLRTDANCVATYKGVPFTVKGKGVCKAQTLANCGIK